MTSPYTPGFQFSDWPDGPLNANLPPAPLSPNAVLNQVEAEFGSIATAFTKTSQVGMVVVTSISNGATIPVPTGFTLAETRFFAFVKAYAHNSATSRVWFSVFATASGVVNATVISGSGDGLNATGVAIARKGGW
ncbi:hypothetical protein WEI85_35770 [Actinomycetes bacterium KLBMP 9797]